ncbi:hypothetical protein ACJIZ3_011898 [Penstemon smallii]|uniref:Uncharacterized protein n=1 Tax=Penstemon smallii TaxID=265156 RepID=A0ABD3UM11_9LAMI
MASSSPLIFDISSDEEADFGDAAKSGGGVGGLGDREDHNWLSELLGEVDRSNKVDRDIYDDTDDDVVLLGEVFLNPPKKSRQKSVKPSAKVGGGCGSDNDDDDCVVLDGNPDKVAFVGNGRTDDVDDSDDLVIVGEKGEVACRDFPHSRHLCAKFLFASTPHNVHCSQCHCYVCDSLAPCTLWGTGTSSIDHCHATDKEEYWRAERKSTKKGDKPMPVPLTMSNASFLAGVHQNTQLPALTPPLPNSLLPTQGLRPVTMRSCSTSYNTSVPNAINQGRIHPPGDNVPRYKPQLQVVSPQLHNAFNSNVSLRDKSYNAENKSSRFSPTRAVLKKTGFTGASPNNRRGFRSPLSRNPTLKRSHAIQTPSLNVYQGSSQRNIRSRVANSVINQRKMSASPSIDARCANHISSQPQIQTHLISSSQVRDPAAQPQIHSSSHLSSNFGNVVSSLEPQVASQTNAGNFENMILSQPDLVFQPNCFVSSQDFAANQSDIGSALLNQHSRSITSSNPNMSNTFEHQSSQPDAWNNSCSLSQSGLPMCSVDFDFEWGASPSHDNLQAPAEISQPQTAAPADDHHRSIPQVDNNFNQKSVAPVDNSSLLDDTGSHFPVTTNPDTLDFQFESWLFENQSLPGAFVGPVSPHWNVVSPEPSSIEAGTLFDI